MILSEYLKIPTNKEYKAVNLYYEVFGFSWGYDITLPSEFVKKSWQALKDRNHNNGNINGSIFEYLIALCLYSKGILPFYKQAKVTFVPNAIYDLVLYSTTGTLITLSIKSSLRERYKQADLEGWALKNVHRNAINYLITLDKTATRVAKKISNGDITGLNKIIVATNTEFDELIDELATYSYTENKQFTIIDGGELIGAKSVKGENRLNQSSSGSILS
jgi:hypothetical protein